MTLPRYFVDTSAWYALIDRKDPDHRVITECIQKNQACLTTSDYVFDETVTLLRYRLGWKVAHVFGTTLLSGQSAVIAPVADKDKAQAWRIFSDYQDQKFSFTDCTSFALLQRLKITTAISMDSDFSIFGFFCVP